MGKVLFHLSLMLPLSVGVPCMQSCENAVGDVGTGQKCNFFRLFVCEEFHSNHQSYINCDTWGRQHTL